MEYVEDVDARPEPISIARCRELLGEDGESITKEAQLNDLTRPFVEDRKTIKCLLERDNVDATVWRGNVNMIDRHRSMPSPRFTARRARAASTNTRRIIRAVVVKKCARFCQWTFRQSSKRKYDSCTSSVGCHRP